MARLTTAASPTGAGRRISDMTEPTTGAWRDDLSLMWLEITGRCQLECTHC